MNYYPYRDTRETTPKCGVSGPPGTLTSLDVLRTLSGLTSFSQLLKPRKYHLRCHDVIQLLSRPLVEDLEDRFRALVKLVSSNVLSP